MKRLSRPAVLLAIAATAMVMVLLPRLWIELQWFQQFELGPVVLKRWGLQFLALVLVLGIGIPVQLNQLQRCWKLRRRDPAYRGESIFMPLKGWGLLLVLLLVLGLLSTATSYLFVQALGLLQEPFSGIVLSSFPVLGSLPLALVIGIAAVLLVFLLRWPLTTLRVSLSLAILASATALARAWSFWLPAILASPFGEGDPGGGDMPPPGDDPMGAALDDSAAQSDAGAAEGQHGPGPDSMADMPDPAAGTDMPKPEEDDQGGGALG